MATTRERILQKLLDHPRSTIKDLAEAVSINAISVRHHLASLQADNLVVSEEERHGVGRPRLVYSLTKKGSEVFPSNYLDLTDRLLNQLTETLPEKEMENLFVNMADHMIDELRPELATLKDERERVQYLEDKLANTGHSIQWEEDEDGNYVIEVSNCPYLHISKSHPIVCVYDERIFEQVLGMKTEKTSSICQGDRVCCYLAKSNRGNK
jgi:predicted ArsR family transcriptional regulator